MELMVLRLILLLKKFNRDLLVIVKLVRSTMLKKEENKYLQIFME
jgi:hypothetical protein